MNKRNDTKIVANQWVGLVRLYLVSLGPGGAHNIQIGCRGGTLLWLRG